MPRSTVAAVVVAAAAGVVAAAAGSARADDDFGGASVIFARGSALYRVDPRGKGESEIAQLAGKPSPRALRTDAGGSVLLADLAGKWAWMPLDGQARSLTELPCADGPAQLAEDGSAVLCRSARSASQSILVPLRPAAPASRAPAVVALDIPPGAARIIGSGAERKLVWGDATGVWMAPASDPRRKTRAALDAPLRGFLPSPDGTRAIGVYTDEVYADVHHTRAAEVLMTVALDGQGPRRKAIRDGVAVEWSRDAQWVLVQDGASTCIVRATGGEYKCWKGYTAASLSSDGHWGLAFGNRDGARTSSARAGRGAAKSSGKSAKPDKSTAARSAPAKGAPGRPRPDRDVGAAARPGEGGPDRSGDKPWDRIDEPSDEPEADPADSSEGASAAETGEAQPADDVSVPPPSGPLSLYRVRLDGAFTDRPALLVKVVDGAAVWVPGRP